MPSVGVCDSIAEESSCTYVTRPNNLSVTAHNSNRKKYVNSLHYSQVSGLTPTSPFDINDPQ